VIFSLMHRDFRTALVMLYPADVLRNAKE